MSDNDLTTIRKYGSGQEAHLAKNLLASAGIPACVADETTATWLAYVGTALGGAKLQVAKRDAESARAALRESESHEPEAPGADWNCSRCGADVDADFEICWSCELPREESSCDKLPDRNMNPAKFAAASARDQEAEEDFEVETAADADAQRAWRAALLGLVFPPLFLYALYLTLRTMNRELSPRATRRFYGSTLR